MNQGLVTLVFVNAVFLIGILTRYLLRRTRFPYSIALLIIGLSIGYLAELGYLGAAESDWLPGVLQVAHLDPHFILMLFLPALIFESAYSMESHLFLRMVGQITLLAVPGLIIAILLTALLVQLAFPWAWSWPVAMLFGALISATDPVAVVALLKETSSRKRLETLLEGESLLNDGTAIVFFGLFFSLIVQGGEAQFNLWQMTEHFVRVVSLGVLVGGLIGGVAVLWMGRLFNDASIEIGITLVGAYGAFYIAEHSLHASGVVAVVTLAIMLASTGRTRLSPEVEPSLHHFWQMLSYLFNTLIFVMVGIIIAQRVRLDDPLQWLTLLLLYIGLLLIRAASIVVLLPLLSRIGIGIDRRKVVVLIWGGLRGAVALCLALAVAQALPGALGEQILFLTAGVVVLTIVINGSTMGWLLARLKLDRLPQAKQAAMDRARQLVDQQVHEYKASLSHSQLFRRVDWPNVESYLMSTQEGVATESISGEDLGVAFRRQLLDVEREFYWLQYREGLLGRMAVTSLVEAVEEALDGEPVISPRSALLADWQRSKLLDKGTRRMKKLMEQNQLEYQSLVYGTARTFVEGQYQLRQLAEKLAPNDALKQAVQAEIDDNIYQGEAQIESLLLTHGDVVAKIETHIVSRLLLNREREEVKALARSGVLDGAEASKLIDEIEACMASLKGNI